MRNILIIFFTLISANNSTAQSKIISEVSGGVLMIKEDVGQNVVLNIGYRTSQSLTVSLSAMYADMDSKGDTPDYSFKKIALSANKVVIGNENFGLISNFGFSLLQFSSVYSKGGRNGAGIDMGLQPTFQLHKRMHYGFVLTTTFSTISHGGIFQSNFFIKYNF